MPHLNAVATVYHKEIENFKFSTSTCLVVIFFLTFKLKEIAPLQIYERGAKR
jgi:hypothetical protein